MMIMLKRVAGWLSIVAWVAVVATFVNALSHASDRDPAQWGAAMLWVMCTLFAMAMTAAYLLILLVLKLLANRRNSFQQHTTPTVPQRGA
jgi:hypothetical protein